MYGLRFVGLDPELEARLFNLIQEWEKGLKAFERKKIRLGEAMIKLMRGRSPDPS